jgi:hypothetical protein
MGGAGGSWEVYRMFQILRRLDQLLRHELTRPEQIAADPVRGFDLPLRRFVPLAVGLGATYGFFMGWFALTQHWGKGTTDGWMQLIAGMIKLPALFLLTLAGDVPVAVRVQRAPGHAPGVSSRCCGCWWRRSW